MKQLFVVPITNLCAIAKHHRISSYRQLRVLSRSVTLMIVFTVLSSPSFAQTPQPEILTNSSIISMKKMNLSSGIIKNKINVTPCNFKTDVQSLSELKSAGIDDDIIEVMMGKSTTAQIVTTAVTSGVGTLSEDTKTYVSSQGTTFHVGDPIKINVGSNPLTGAFKYISKDQGKILNAINDPIHLRSDYSQQTFTIKEMYSARSSSNDMFIKNAPRTTYIVFETTPNIKYRIAIEAALQQKEVLPN